MLLPKLKWSGMIFASRRLHASAPAIPRLTCSWCRCERKFIYNGWCASSIIQHHPASSSYRSLHLTQLTPYPAFSKSFNPNLADCHRTSWLRAAGSGNARHGWSRIRRAYSARHQRAGCFQRFQQGPVSWNSGVKGRMWKIWAAGPGANRLRWANCWVSIYVRSAMARRKSCLAYACIRLDMAGFNHVRSRLTSSAKLLRSIRGRPGRAERSPRQGTHHNQYFAIFCVFFTFLVFWLFFLCVFLPLLSHAFSCSCFIAFLFGSLPLFFPHLPGEGC